jgi:hypothetical protein
MKPIFLGCILIILLAACNSAMRDHTYQRNWTSRIHNYEDGKKILMKIDKYRNSNLVESRIFYERWPNGELKLISKKGFYVVKDDVSYRQRPDVPVPDGILVHYFDSNYVPFIQVYENGKEVPYTLGYSDGHSSMQFRKVNPGVYTWKDGQEYLEREFTEAEWKNHYGFEKALNAGREKDSTQVISQPEKRP